MSERGGNTGKAYDDLASEVVKFSPSGFVRTVGSVWSAAGDLQTGKGADTRLADAIAEQDWSAVLPPIRYAAAIYLLYQLLFWAQGSLGEGKLPSQLNLLSPMAIALVAATIASSIPIHVVLTLWPKRSERRVSGWADGTIKITQVYAYVTASFLMLVLIPMSVFSLLPQITSSEDIQAIVGFVFLFYSAALAIPLWFIAWPRVLAELYGISPWHAGLTILISTLGSNLIAQAATQFFP